MPLPEFNDLGDLPEGAHPAPFAEVRARFGHDTPQRQLVTKRLARIYQLAQRTGKLERFIIYGSYVTAKPAPNDVDIIADHAGRFSPAGMRCGNSAGLSSFAGAS